MAANLKIITALVLLTGFLSCKKETSPSVFTLPAATSEGLNTIGFEYGTEVFVNYGQVCFLTSGCRPNTDAFYYRNDGQLRLGGDKVIKRNGSLVSTETVAIYVETDHRGTMVYDSKKGDIISVAYDIEKGGVETGYMLDPVNPVSVVALTRIDTTAGILSGSFSASLFRRTAQGFDVVRTDSFIIRNGRFDLKYK